ncbi:MAG: hypothetical protein JWM10_1482 [Myxococcaceae bacterium]|nr:hypothetical protein [Myxococcaceae bacterium]
MNRFSTLLLTSVLAGSLGACSDDPVVTDAGTGTDSGTCSPPADAGGPTPYFQCTSDNICPTARYTNNAMTPGYRLTYIKITQPAALASAAILSTINPTLQRGSFLWGLQLNLTNNTFRTGGLNPMLTRGTVGQGLMDGQFAFFNNNGPGAMPNQYNPLSGMVTVMGDRATTSMASTTVNIPIFTDAAGTMLLTQLPMDNARLSNIQLTTDRGCIGLGHPTGGRYTETTSAWLTEDGATPAVPYGVVDADITVENAKLVNVTIGGTPTPLCNIISGANCVTDPQGSWARQPDSIVGAGTAMNAYHLRANFAAISANIAAP